VANYVKSTNFAVKDGLAQGDPGKIVKGTEIDIEFNNIASAIESKADTNSPTFTGAPLAPTAAGGTTNTQIATTAFVSAAVTAATGTLGTMSSQNANSVAITGGSVTGITDLAVADGGTGASSITSNSVILGNGSNALNGNLVAPGSSGNVLTSNGTTWASSAPSVSVSSFTGSNQSIGTNGYQKLPGGLIIQWGSNTSSSPNNSVPTTTNNFPIAFTSIYAFVATPNGNTPATDGDWATVFTTTQFGARHRLFTVSYTWIAIGV
jgi:hypothetical protein